MLAGAMGAGASNGGPVDVRAGLVRGDSRATASVPWALAGTEGQQFFGAATPTNEQGGKLRTVAFLKGRPHVLEPSNSAEKGMQEPEGGTSCKQMDPVPMAQRRVHGASSAGPATVSDFTAPSSATGNSGRAAQPTFPSAPQPTLQALVVQAPSTVTAPSRAKGCTIAGAGRAAADERPGPCQRHSPMGSASSTTSTIPGVTARVPAASSTRSAVTVVAVNNINSELGTSPEFESSVDSEASRSSSPNMPKKDNAETHGPGQLQASSCDDSDNPKSRWSSESWTSQGVCPDQWADFKVDHDDHSLTIRLRAWQLLCQCRLLTVTRTLGLCLSLLCQSTMRVSSSSSSSESRVDHATPSRTRGTMVTVNSIPTAGLCRTAVIQFILFAALLLVRSSHCSTEPPTPCPLGWYNDTSLAGSSFCGLCAAGSFGGMEGLTSPACSGNCSAGYACPAGSTNATAVMCSAGQYSLSGAASCALCPASAPFSSPGSASCYSACPNATWTAWLDAAGVEGAHSCLKRVTAASATWSTANASCAALGGRSHLLTSRQVLYLM
jgi:hypothetical protein